ncbi:methyltransferase-like protein 22 [Bombina bombina]|uniref:methyltransferase-like protein 22 n=1 Tax=Bombina bombina TaxID=8345 RepID=UPI00235B1DD2|nr:methyltransferase-like protein 22 [Bombina bombina]
MLNLLGDTCLGNKQRHPASDVTAWRPTHREGVSCETPDLAKWLFPETLSSVANHEGLEEKPEMDAITFSKDTVLSDVHLLSPRRRHFMVRLNAVGQAVFLSQFKILWSNNVLEPDRRENREIKNKKNTNVEYCDENYDITTADPKSSAVQGREVLMHGCEDLNVTQRPCESQAINNLLDEDGDLEVIRRPRECQAIDNLLDEDGDLEVIQRPCESQGIDDLLDEDGDLEVIRRQPQGIQKALDNDGNHTLISNCAREEQTYSRDVVCPTIITIGNGNYSDDEELASDSCDVVKIEHTMATPLEDVGKQIWRGAFLLADYILWQKDQFSGRTVLELGAGTGFSSIVTAAAAKTVYCTDVGDDLLEMCERNVALNRRITGLTGSEVKVKELDWLKHSLSSDSEAQYGWSEDEIADLYDHTTVILAADIFYDDDLTDALFKTLYRITYSLRNSCTIYLSIERRLNFTLRDLDITCEAYNYFRSCLENFENIQHGKVKWRSELIKPTFPQFFSYERVALLELWKIISEPLT